ncbi:amylo-alpha-1,6-glucosidase [Tessaracoccus antarcticus]|uniref:Mannosylglycerate hydrolase MGH1-like glycoside hydrolase domain-containing protein n=1 Tax=Tessaracoccus antarcticus TaxID=2479848 RepID=A0A3M0GBE2_9ACTN|nr:hypothetical protein [Tessaracoccus antarcticus]RMB61698.1 hypothetical protein EAX62_03465 [Tessaracoccus antarcticus]
MPPVPTGDLPVLDLDEIPYTVGYSRLFVRADGDALTVYRAAYERSLAESIVVGSLRLRDTTGGVVAVLRATPLGIEFADGTTLVVTPRDTVHIGTLPPGTSLEMDLSLPRMEAGLTPDRLVLPTDATASVTEVLTRVGTPTGGDILIACAGPLPEPVSHEQVLAVTSTNVRAWLARCPTVEHQWQSLVTLCWWVLGVNTLELGGAALGRAVVPSKLGYVGLWQWDAYFIAIGLRHGDPELAVEQLRVALSHPQPSGQLPDVVHEDGVLASSDDLPPGDLETLRAMASPSLAHSRIPLTKPPLTALAVALVAEQSSSDIVDEFIDAIVASQDWWYAESDPRGTGTPAYLHPYSSGLDDSPIFDHDAMVSSPDLAAYLILQDRILAGWLRERGRAQDADRCTLRADGALVALAAQWEPHRGFFPSIGDSGQPLSTDAVVGLLPLLVEDLPSEMAAALLAASTDPHRYGTPHRLPTVAADDPSFSPERMWRGPVWVNINWLVARGMRQQGFAAAADALERETLEMATLSGGPHEYFNPMDASKPPRSTTCFGWSSALLVDMAVRLSSAD